MKEETLELSLANLKEGGAVEAFDVEMQKALTNIQDLNTEAKTKREVVLKVSISPTEDRERGVVKIECTAKLAPIKPTETVIYMGNRGGKAVAVEASQRTPPLFAVEQSN
jgi:hypothetical protein